MKYSIRPARAQDCTDIQRMIMDLAVYEKMPDQVKISHKELERDGFGPNPFFQCLVAEVAQEHCSPEGHTVVGYALYFYTYSTWSGRCVYMEDLYVMPNFRGKGVGKALMATIAKVATEQQCVRLQFSVLDWNKPSLEFYLSKGAQDLTDKEGWHFLRFDGEALDNLAQEAPPTSTCST
ncbi:diamine acetyltransferase 2b [Astyanax mexicanus]|uniref:diamine acetyltransferase 2b n=1 Tax=Astyanax mexicanus TaxID=7994 RepID=UPI0020CB1D0D|nr:diamine acetyltransferase 2b [Astyanax mexicanus]